MDSHVFISHSGFVIEAEPPPYKKDQLQPHLSKEILFYHYEKHHLGYVKKANQLLKENPEFSSIVNLEGLIQVAREENKIDFIQ